MVYVVSVSVCMKVICHERDGGLGLLVLFHVHLCLLSCLYSPVIRGGDVLLVVMSCSYSPVIRGGDVLLVLTCNKRV